VGSNAEVFANSKEVAVEAYVNEWNDVVDYIAWELFHGDFVSHRACRVLL